MNHCPLHFLQTEFQSVLQEPWCPPSLDGTRCSISPWKCSEEVCAPSLDGTMCCAIPPWKVQRGSGFSLPE
ncbi:hypothetical protein E2C01_011656 [Portunus trituberculatus]|uniref:Uncharacterized protein n=1 Tax=Portunus trituberculatus TaxID=210409 RepID=A0A5B7DBW1_PORTR|nr:hypothetical protein [Portunus trituberculatus]